VLQNQKLHCQLTYDPALTNGGTPVDGTFLPPLLEGATLSINITLNLIPNYSGALNPGRDLAVTIRL
jgi:hypothetical protein